MAYRIARWLGIAALVIGYPLLAHYTNASANHGQLGAWVAIVPVVLFALVLAWRSPQRYVMLSGVALLCVALGMEWSALERHFGLVYWLQYVGMQLILFMTFARTLSAGRQPLCARYAAAVHAAPLTRQHQRYARHVTVAWSGFFALMATLSTALFFLAPLTLWSIFDNFLTLPLVALMFIGEYGVRRWVLPDTQQTHILDALRAFRTTSARPR